MTRREAVGLLAAAAMPLAAGCAGDEEVHAEAARAFNSALDLVERAASALAEADAAWEREAWRDAERLYDLAMSRYDRAGGRFAEARTEGRGCERLVGAAADMVGYCSDMKRACNEWLRATNRRRRGEVERAEDRRRAGDRWAERAGEHARYEKVDTESPAC